MGCVVASFSSTMDAAHPSSASTHVPVHDQLPACNTIPVGGIFEQWTIPLLKTSLQQRNQKRSLWRLQWVNMATMMEQQAAQIANTIQFSMNASAAAQQSTDNILRILALQIGHREGGALAASQLVVAQLAASVSVTASVEEDLTEEVSTFINKMASSFEKVVKKYVQAKRNLKTAEE